MIGSNLSHFRVTAKLAVVDTASGTWRIVVPAGAFDSIVSSSRDGSKLLVEREVMDADIWLLEARPPSRGRGSG